MAGSEDNYIPRVLYAEVRKAYCDSTWVKYVFAGTTAGLAGSAAIIAVAPPRTSPLPARARDGAPRRSAIWRRGPLTRHPGRLGAHRPHTQYSSSHGSDLRPQFGVRDPLAPRKRRHRRRSAPSRHLPHALRAGGSIALGAVTGVYYRNSCLRGAWDEVMRAHIAGKEDGQFQEYPQPPVGFWTELNQILADEEASE